MMAAPLRQIVCPGSASTRLMSWYTARQIAAFGQERGKRSSRHRNDEVSDRELPGRLHAIEANWNALGRIPYQAGRRLRAHRGDHDRCGATHAEERQEAEAHGAIPRRRSQA